MNPLLAVKAAEILPKAIGVVVLISIPVATAVVVKNYVRTSQKNSNYSNATDAEQPEFYAIQFENALSTDWYDWNVDEEEVYRLLKLLPNRAFFEKVNKAYLKITTRTLIEDLKKVGSEDHKIVMQLIQQIPT